MGNSASVNSHSSISLSEIIEEREMRQIVTEGDTFTENIAGGKRCWLMKRDPRERYSEIEIVKHEIIGRTRWLEQRDVLRDANSN